MADDELECHPICRDFFISFVIGQRMVDASCFSPLKPLAAQKQEGGKKIKKKGQDALEETFANKRNLSMAYNFTSPRTSDVGVKKKKKKKKVRYDQIIFKSSSL